MSEAIDRRPATTRLPPFLVVHTATGHYVRIWLGNVELLNAAGDVVQTIDPGRNRVCVLDEHGEVVEELDV